MKIIWLVYVGSLFIPTVNGVNEDANAKRKNLWDLNKSPPESPQSNGETNIQIPAEEDNLSNLQNVQKSKKRKAEEGKQGKRKTIKNTYLEGLTQQEKKTIRNKLWYATLVSKYKEELLMCMMIFIILLLESRYEEKEAKIQSRKVS